MNIKNISIVLTILLVAIAATVLMQKGNYVSLPELMAMTVDQALQKLVHGGRL